MCRTDRTKADKPAEYKGKPAIRMRTCPACGKGSHPRRRKCSHCGEPESVFVITNWGEIDSPYLLVYGDGSPRIYGGHGGKLDGRLAGFGKLAFFKDFAALVQHFHNATGPRKRSKPVRVSTALLGEFFPARKAKAWLKAFHESSRAEAATTAA